MLDHAKSEAEAIVAKAEADTKTMIVRREKMAHRTRLRLPNAAW